jgi:hypothetical protein
MRVFSVRPAGIHPQHPLLASSQTGQKIRLLMRTSSDPIISAKGAALRRPYGTEGPSEHLPRIDRVPTRGQSPPSAFCPPSSPPASSSPPPESPHPSPAQHSPPFSDTIAEFPGVESAHTTWVSDATWCLVGRHPPDASWRVSSDAPQESHDAGSMRVWKALVMHLERSTTQHYSEKKTCNFKRKPDYY